GRRSVQKVEPRAKSGGAQESIRSMSHAPETTAAVRRWTSWTPGAPSGSVSSWAIFRTQASERYHLVEDEHVQVAKIARYEEYHDLAMAVRKDIVPAGEAVEDQQDVVGLVAFLD
ncbi:hypothetical protein MKK69_19565, partial [Methylobacterium sp. J-026]